MVSCVMFTMEGLRLARAWPCVNWLFRPFRAQRFLNVRTYVRHEEGRGIHFIAEWISDRLCVSMGPALYSLPYRWGRFERGLERGGVSLAEPETWTERVTGVNEAAAIELEVRCSKGDAPRVCEPGSQSEFLLERYAAFNGCGRRRKRMFAIAHAPWRRRQADVAWSCVDLLSREFPWFRDCRPAGAEYSIRLKDVRMGAPRAV